MGRMKEIAIMLQDGVPLQTIANHMNKSPRFVRSDYKVADVIFYQTIRRTYDDMYDGSNDMYDGSGEEE